jgi:hypothetical protein
MHATSRTNGYRSALLCTWLFVGSSTVGAIAIWLAPSAGSAFAYVVGGWGSMLQVLVPSVRHIPELTAFKWNAWCASVVVWTLMPLGAYAAWRCKALWTPDEIRIRRQPLILVFCALVFAFVVIGAMQYSPTTRSLAGFGFARRVLSLMVSSKAAYALVLGFIATGVSLSAGLLIQAAQLAHKIFIRRK